MKYSILVTHHEKMKENDGDLYFMFSSILREEDDVENSIKMFCVHAKTLNKHSHSVDQSKEHIKNNRKCNFLLWKREYHYWIKVSFYWNINLIMRKICMLSKALWRLHRKRWRKNKVSKLSFQVSQFHISQKCFKSLKEREFESWRLSKTAHENWSY
jgi:hypothetical protein